MNYQKDVGSRKYSHVYTLIELMVVLATISILTTTLFSVMNVARERIKTQECVENERYIYSSILEYSNDNQGKVVPSQGFKFKKVTIVLDWQDTLRDYGLEHVQGLDGEEHNPSLYCPISGKTGGPKWIDHNPDYGLNNELAPNGLNAYNGDTTYSGEKPRRFASINNFSEKVLLADSSGSGTVLRGDFRLGPAWIRQSANINRVGGKGIG